MFDDHPDWKKLPLKSFIATFEIKNYGFTCQSPVLLYIHIKTHPFYSFMGI